MKRVGYLMDKVSDFGHLYRSYKKALKGSGKTHESMEFSFRLEYELLELSRRLKAGTYRPAAYRFFKIYDPKERQIAVAPFRDRVIHHAVVGVFEPIYERCFIFDSYATRKGKGVHAARARAQHYLKSFYWYGKSDIHQYFASIDHEILLRLLERKIKDQALLTLIQYMLANGGEGGKGLPVGNLTSQFFANVYLNPLDHFVKEELRLKGYVRYMDDFVWWGHKRTEVKRYLNAISSFLEDKLMLSLKDKATLINHRRHGLPFLGARIFPSLMRIRQENLQRLIRRLKRKRWEFERGTMSEEQYQASLNSYYAYWRSFDSVSLRKALRGIHM